MKSVVMKYGWLGIPVFFWLITRIIGFEGVYGQDAYSYFYHAEDWQEFIVTGQSFKTFEWPVMYSFFGGLLGFILPLDMALQFISLFALLGITFFLERIILLKKTELNTLKFRTVIIVFVCLSPYFLRTGLLVMSDMLCAFFLIGAFFFSSRKNKYDFSLALIFLVLALFTRYAAVFIVVPLLIYLIKNQSVQWKQLPLPILATGLVGSLYYLVHGYNAATILQHNALVDWSFTNFFNVSFSNDRSFEYWVPNFVYVLSPFGHLGYSLLGVPLLVWAWIKKIRLNWLPVIITLPYLIFLAGLPIQNQRFLVLAFPFASLFFLQIWMTANVPFKNKILILTAVLQVSFFTYSFYKFYRRVAFEKELTELLKTDYQERTVFTFDVDVCFKYYGVNSTVNNIFYKEYSKFNSGNLFIANPVDLERNWKGFNPHKNWMNVNQYIIQENQTFNNGWKIFEIE